MVNRFRLDLSTFGFPDDPFGSAIIFQSACTGSSQLMGLSYPWPGAVFSWSSPRSRTSHGSRDGNSWCGPVLKLCMTSITGCSTGTTSPCSERGQIPAGTPGSAAGKGKTIPRKTKARSYPFGESRHHCPLLRYMPFLPELCTADLRCGTGPAFRPWQC